MILLANPEEPEISPYYSFFEHRKLGKSRAERSALGIEIGLPTVSKLTMSQDVVASFGQGGQYNAIRSLANFFFYVLIFNANFWAGIFCSIG
jgi:hypothetical protein